MGDQLKSAVERGRALHEHPDTVGLWHRDEPLTHGQMADLLAYCESWEKSRWETLVRLNQDERRKRLLDILHGIKYCNDDPDEAVLEIEDLYGVEEEE